MKSRCACCAVAGGPAAMASMVTTAIARSFRIVEVSLKVC
jgi:hypothetical protein